MTARELLVRIIDCVNDSGFVSKSEALYSGKRSTADIIASNLELQPETSQVHLDKHGGRADEIINWVLNTKVTDDYMNSCFEAVSSVVPGMKKHLGVLCSLPSAYAKYIAAQSGMDKITNPNAFSADPGTRFTGRCEVINIRNFDTYAKVSMVDLSTGCLVAFTESFTEKKRLTGTVKSSKLAVGDLVDISAQVYRNKFTTPFETTLSRPTIEKI